MVKKAAMGVALVVLAEVLAQPPKGKVLPPISLPTLDGKQFTLKVVYDKKRKAKVLSVTLRHRSKGKWVTKTIPAKAVLLDFWASWCGPCMAAIPHLVSLHKRYSKKGLLVVGVNLGERRSTVSRVVRSMGVPYIVVLDQRLKTPKPYKIKGIPMMVVVDSRGIVRHTQVGFSRRLERELEEVIKSLLGIR